MDLSIFKPGMWVQSVYGEVGILQDPPIDGHGVNAVRAHDNKTFFGEAKQGEPMRTNYHFVSIVPEGTPDGPLADTPVY